MRNNRNLLCFCAVVACAILVAVPLVSAAGTTLANARDDPQLLSGLRFHVAYYGELQQAQMDGTIRYINIISNGSAIYDLQNFEEDYLTAASTIPLMNTADDINSARETMQTKTRKFSEETKNLMLKYDGKYELLNRWVNVSVNDTESAIGRANGTYWLAAHTSRLTVFNMYSTQRESLLTRLEDTGLNVTDAREISSAIEDQRDSLKAAVLKDDVTAVNDLNNRIGEQNKKFRNLVAAYRDLADSGSA
ncbi:MAG: hypothetical protein WC342_09560 [Methanoregula sp.]|jgi:hypothetical protein